MKALAVKVCLLAALALVAAPPAAFAQESQPAGRRGGRLRCPRL